MQHTLSFVIPALNEEESIEQLHAEIIDVCGENGFEFEVVFVDDGSTDATWDKICLLYTSPSPRD